MTDADLAHIIHALDQALNTFRRHEGRLTAAQVRARSLLAVTRTELAQALSDACHNREAGTEVFVDPATERSGPSKTASPFSA